MKREMRTMRAEPTSSKRSRPRRDIPTCDYKVNLDTQAVIKLEATGSHEHDGNVSSDQSSTSEAELRKELLLKRLLELREKNIELKLREKQFDLEEQARKKKLQEEQANAKNEKEVSADSSGTALEENNKGGETFEYIGLVGTPPHALAFDTGSMSNLQSIDLTRVKMDFEDFVEIIISCPQLRSVKLKSVEFTRNGKALLKDFELFDRLNHFVTFAPKGVDFVTQLFHRPQMMLSVCMDDVQSQDCRGARFKILEFSASPPKLVSSAFPSFRNILEAITFQPPTTFCLSALHLKSVNIESSTAVALQSVFENLEALSMEDVFFHTKDPKLVTGLMPPDLFSAFRKLVKLRILINRPTNILCTLTQAFPKTLKHVAVLQAGAGYYNLPVTGHQFEHVFVDSTPLTASTPLNTKFLCIDAIGRLSLVLAAEPRGTEVRGIWVKRDQAKCTADPPKITGLLALLFKQLRIPKDHPNFLLLRDAFEEPWRVEFPDDEKTKELELKFLVNFQF